MPKTGSFSLDLSDREPSRAPLLYKNNRLKNYQIDKSTITFFSARIITWCLTKRDFHLLFNVVRDISFWLFDKTITTRVNIHSISVTKTLEFASGIIQKENIFRSSLFVTWDGINRKQKIKRMEESFSRHPVVCSFLLLNMFGSLGSFVTQCGHHEDFGEKVK